MERDDLVHAIQELRPEQARNFFPLRVRGHDDDRVFEIDGPALAVGEAPVIEHLQEHMEHVAVGLLDFVQQHHRVWAPANSFG